MAFKISRKILSNYIEEDNETNVVIPEGVKKITGIAFRDHLNLVSVEIPASVEIIDACTFRNCRNLESVVFKGEPDKIGTLAFYGCNKLENIKSSEGIAEKYLREFCERMKQGEFTAEEGKELYKISKAKGKVTIKEFSNVWFAGGDDPRHYIYKKSDREDFLAFPETIDGNEVDKIPCKTIPENMIVYCSGDYYKKLPRSSRTATAVAWLNGDPLIRNSSENEIIDFIKKYSEDVAYSMGGSNVTAYNKFIDVASPKASLVKKMIEKAEDNPEITAILLQATQEKKEEVRDILSFEKPKMTATELKKLWTAQLLTDGETGEKIYWITNYKGVNEYVVIPAYIGKYRVDYVDVDFPEHVKSVEVESQETRLSHKTKMDIIRINKNS